MSEGVTCTAILAKYTSTVDGGVNFTFSVNEDEQAAVLDLIKLKGVLIQLACVPLEDHG